MGVKRLLFLLLLMILILFRVQIIVYSAEITGDLEVGEKSYSEVLVDDGSYEDINEEIVDYYYYTRFWLKYKQSLKGNDYYYIKGQYYKKEYEEDQNYNNVSLDLWGNYTYQLTEKIRTKWLLTLRKKDYFTNVDNSYYLAIRI